MKKKLLLAALVTLSCMAFAQEPPEPKWMSEKPSAQGYKFLFFTASGQGATREKAREEAFAKAYIEGIRANGMAVVEKQTFADIRKKGVSAYIEGTNGHAVAIYCEGYVAISDDQFVAYVLIQMARSAAQNPYFEDAEDMGNICQKEEFAERVKKYQQERKKQAKKYSQPFWKNEYNNYLSFGVSNGFTSGLMAGGYFMGRHGGLVGFGYQGAVNVGLSNNMSAENREMNYSLGLKLYYRTTYVGVYGTRLNKSMPFDNNNYGKFGLAGNTVSTNLSYLIGNDFCFGRGYGEGVGGVFSIAAGVINPAWEEWESGLQKWAFAWHIGFGLIF
jgi:hypothetical protein